MHVSPQYAYPNGLPSLTPSVSDRPYSYHHLPNNNSYYDPRVPRQLPDPRQQQYHHHVPSITNHIDPIDSFVSLPLLCVLFIAFTRAYSAVYSSLRFRRETWYIHPLMHILDTLEQCHILLTSWSCPLRIRWLPQILSARHSDALDISSPAWSSSIVPSHSGSSLLWQRQRTVILANPFRLKSKHALWSKFASFLKLLSDTTHGTSLVTSLMDMSAPTVAFWLCA